MIFMIMIVNDIRGWLWSKFSWHLSYGWGKNPRKNLNQENWPDRGSNPGALGERQRCYPLTTAVVSFFLLILVALCGDFTVSLILFAARFSDICSDTCAVWISYCSECADTRDWTFLIFIFVATFLKQLPKSSDHRGGWVRCTSYIFW